MANLYANLIALLACLSFVSGYVNENIQEFQRLKAVVFKKGDLTCQAETIGEHINEMIQLLETGEVPIVGPNKDALWYLKSVVADCAVERECNPHRDMSKLKRLNRRLIETESKYGNLDNYLRTRELRLRENCSDIIYQHVIKTVDQVSLTDMAAIDRVARHVPRSLNQYVLDIDYSPIVLNAIRESDPVGLKQMAAKWIGAERALRGLIDANILLPCRTFIQHIDPIIEEYPIKYTDTTNEKADLELSKLHLFSEVCERILDGSENIIKGASKIYKVYL